MLELIGKPQSKESIRFNGTRFRKQILRFGEFRHPHPELRDKPEFNFSVDDEFVDKIRANFLQKFPESVKFLSSHSEPEAKLLGSVVDLIKTSEGLDAIIEVEDKSKIKEIQALMGDGKSLASGVSAGLDLDFGVGDSSKKKPDGPVLRHVASVTIPWIDGLEGWKTVEEAHAGANFGHDNYTGYPLFNTQEEETVNEAAVIAFFANKTGKKEDEVKKMLADAGINLENPEEDDDDDETVKSIMEFLKDLQNSNTPKGGKKDKKGRKIKASNKKKDDDDDDDDSDDDDSTGVSMDEVKKYLSENFGKSLADLANSLKTGNEELEKMQKAAKEREAGEAVEALINAGSVLPAEREHYVALYTKDKDLFESITKTLKPRVDFNNGPSYKQPTHEGWRKDMDDDAVEAEIKEALTLMNEIRKPVSGKYDNVIHGDKK